MKMTTLAWIARLFTALILGGSCMFWAGCGPERPIEPAASVSSLQKPAKSPIPLPQASKDYGKAHYSLTAWMGQFDSSRRQFLLGENNLWTASCGPRGNGQLRLLTLPRASQPLRWAWGEADTSAE